MANNLVGVFKKLGKLGELRTQNKENLVSSINEVADKTKVIDTIKEKVDTSVKSVEAGLNYNTIKITKNDGTVENVLIKIQGGGSGSSINVFKSSQNGGSFIAKEVTNTFTIEGLDSTKDVELIYNNLFLINGADYTLDKSTGVVGLAFDMDVDEIIYYIITNTSYDYYDLDNLPDLSLKADKSDVDTLSEKLELKPNNWKTEADLPSSYPRGVSTFYSPSGTWNNYSYVMIRTTKNTDNSVFQEVLDAHRGEKLFFRGSDADKGHWSTWKTVATIEGLPKHFYWELSELNMNNNSTLNDIFNAMKDKSQLACGIVNGGTDIYPRAYGTLKITRITSLIGCAEFSFDKGNRRFIGDFRSVSTNLTEFSGWKEIATTTKINNLSLLNGWTTAFEVGNDKLTAVVSGRVCSITGVLTAGIVTAGTTIANLPNGFKPIKQERRSCNKYKKYENSTIVITPSGEIKIYQDTVTVASDAVVIDITYSVI